MKQIAQEMNKHGKQIGRSAWLVFLGRFQTSMSLPLRELAQNLLRFSLKNADLASAVARVGSIAVLVSITACAQQQLDQFNKDIANLNTALAGGTASAGRPTGAPSALAQNSSTDPRKHPARMMVCPSPCMIMICRPDPSRLDIQNRRALVMLSIVYSLPSVHPVPSAHPLPSLHSLPSLE